MRKIFYLWATYAILYSITLESSKLDKSAQLTAQWLAQHTKPCPQCGIAIEKNGGCDWMKCTQCKHEFCWQCLAPHDHNIAKHQHVYAHLK